MPTSDEEADSAQQQRSKDSEGAADPEVQGPIAGAWAGGEDGMGVTNVFLDQVEVCTLASDHTALV